MVRPEAQHSADDTPLIEEQIETGLQSLLDGYRTSYDPSGERKDELQQRFTLFPNERIPEFDHAYAKAYRASDAFNPTRQIYAMISENGLPYRQNATQAMLGVSSPYITVPQGAGTVACSHLNESRHVVFMEQPAGIRLSELMKTQPRLHEHKIIDHVLQPAIRAMLAMRERKVSHGNFHPGSIFIGTDQSVIGECFTMPPSTQMHYLYHPLERLMCNPLGHGEPSEQTDAYALGMLAYELLYGLDQFRALEKEDYIKLSINLSTYQLFANNRDFSDAFQDFFRGTLNDNPSERWGLDQLQQWLSGKRFNMIAPSPPKEAVRPYAFGGENFFSRRLLAHVFHGHWREAVKEVRGTKLERWCETSLHRPEMAERIERALRIAGEASTERHISDMMSRIIAILDPVGPIRSMSLALRPDAIGPMLAYQLPQEDQTELNQLLGMVESDISSYWAELSDANRGGEMGQTLWKLQRMRPFMKFKTPGFGIERVLYDLNPSLPCQSDMLKQYHITTAAEALRTLDALAKHMAPNTSFLDRHLAAFIASKIDMGKEIRLNDLASIPTLMSNQELVVLKILAKAQQKGDKKEKLELVGLCTWAAMRIEKMIDHIHNRMFRRRLKQQLRRLAATGDLNEVLTAIINREVAVRDYDGFAKAIALHEMNHKKIEKLENPRLLNHMANDMGGKISSTMAYVGLVVTTYIVISNAVGY